MLCQAILGYVPTLSEFHTDEVLTRRGAYCWHSVLWFRIVLEGIQP